MGKKATLSTVTTGYNSAATVNADIAAVNDKLDNTLSLDGSTPNSMQADFDMNNNNIINAGDVGCDSVTIDGVVFVPNNAATVPDWEGAWVTATAYVVNDLVYESGNTYICVEAHTSGTFSTDLAAGKWEIFASKGDTGAGTGDLLAANNLSDLADADTALANLGGGTTGIALFKDTTAAAARTELGLGTAAVAALIDDDSMATATAANIPSAESTKAYVDAQVAAVAVPQWQESFTTARTTLSTTIPYDSTAPTTSEGTLVSTISSVAVAAGDQVEINVDVNYFSNDAIIICVLFRGSTCIAARSFTSFAAPDLSPCASFTFVDDDPGAGTYTYTLRVGSPTTTTGELNALDLAGTQAFTTSVMKSGMRLRVLPA